MLTAVVVWQAGEYRTKVVRVQSAWRGVLGRRRASRRREEAWAEEEGRCAALLQRRWRAVRARRAGAAVSLQAGWRGRMGRQDAARRRVVYEARRRHEGALWLQRCERGRRGRRQAGEARRARDAEWAAAATVLQRLCRHRLERGWWERLRVGRGAAREAAAARRIQRGCRRRWELRWGAAVRLQRACARWRRRHRERVGAAVRLEAHWRGVAARQKWRARLMACAAVQRWCRGWLGRREAAGRARRRWAARLLQRAWQRRWGLVSGAAARLQAGWRGRAGRRGAAAARAKRERRRRRQALKAERSATFRRCDACMVVDLFLACLSPPPAPSVMCKTARPPPSRRQALEALNVFDEVTAAATTAPSSSAAAAAGFGLHHPSLAMATTLGGGTTIGPLLGVGSEMRMMPRRARSVPLRATTMPGSQAPGASSSSSQLPARLRSAGMPARRRAEYLPDIRTGEVEGSLGGSGGRGGSGEHATTEGMRSLMAVANGGLTAARR
jgi:hypothetical protein